MNFNIRFEFVGKTWFVNTTNILILNEVVGLLQLGQDFCLSTFNREENIIECIKAVENNFYIYIHNNNVFRNKLFPLIKELKQIVNRSTTDKDILLIVSTTKKFVSNNPNILFTRADKDNTVMTLDRVEYIENMEKNFSDTNTYMLIPRNPIITN